MSTFVWGVSNPAFACSRQTPPISVRETTWSWKRREFWTLFRVRSHLLATTAWPWCTIWSSRCVDSHRINLAVIRTSVGSSLECMFARVSIHCNFNPEWDYLATATTVWRRAVLAPALICLITHASLSLELRVFHFARMFLKKATNVRLSWDKIERISLF